MTALDQLLGELKSIRETVERVEQLLRGEIMITCRSCSGVFRTRGEYEEHQCGLETVTLPAASSAIDQCPKCKENILIYDSRFEQSYCRNCGWMTA